MSISSFVLTGILAVFSIFVILYIIFILMSLVFRDKGSRKKEVPTPPQMPQQAENHQDDTHIAIISAVITEILGKPVLVKKVYQSRNYDLEDRTTTWRKSGWKGARGWRASSGW
ncbi:OadG family protein [Pseudothermotoga sp. U03pept]|uniref:OadG family protein n=1 Tax=Pseudothermotoga sp. U03pept TaxID=3447012 RepID=UPI003F06566D